MNTPKGGSYDFSKRRGQITKNDHHLRKLRESSPLWPCARGGCGSNLLEFSVRQKVQSRFLQLYHCWPPFCWRTGGRRNSCIKPAQRSDSCAKALQCYPDLGIIALDARRETPRAIKLTLFLRRLALNRANRRIFVFDSKATLYQEPRGCVFDIILVHKPVWERDWLSQLK